MNSKYFANRFFNADVDGATGTTAAIAPAAELTSETLTALKSEKSAKMAELKTLDGDAAEDKMLEIFKINTAIKAEVANIKAEEQKQKIAELRNARVQQLADRDAARDAMVLVNADKKATAEAKEAAKAAFDLLNEPVINAMLAKYATSTTTAKLVVGDKPAGQPRGATSSQIEERLVFHMNAGKSSTDAVKEVIAEGFSRGTTGAVRTQMVKDGKIAN